MTWPETGDDLKGSLTSLPSLLLATDLSSSSATGTLLIRRGPAERRIIFQNGRIISAASNLKRHQTAAWFEAAGTASPALERCVVERLRLRDIVLDGLLWSEGEFEFVDGTPPPTAGELAIEETTAALLLDAARAASGPVHHRLVARLEMLQAVPDAMSAGLSLDPSEWTLLRLLARAQTFEQVCAGAGQAAPNEISRLLAGLIAAGLVSGCSRPDATPATRTAAVAVATQPTAKTSRAAEPPVDAELHNRLEALESGKTEGHYSLLGVQQTADVAAVRAAYYAIARRYHPDAARHLATSILPRVEMYFAAVTDAYNTLTNPTERAEYDASHASRATRTEGAPDARELARQNYDAGRRQQAAGKLHDASQFFSNAVRLDPGRPEYHRELGIVQMQNPRGRQLAEQALCQALEMSPGDVRTLLHIALLYKRTGRLDLATSRFREVLRWEPDNAAALAEISGGAETRPDGGGRFKGLFGRR